MVLVRVSSQPRPRRIKGSTRSNTSAPAKRKSAGEATANGSSPGSVEDSTRPRCLSSKRRIAASTTAKTSM